MAEWTGYFYIEALSMTNPQKQTLVDALRAWGLRNQSDYPNERIHWRTRPDNNAVIFEAVFESDLMTAAALKTRLASIFGVNENLITDTPSTNQYGEIVVFKYASIDRLRVGVFGGRSAGYTESRAAARQFVHDFKAAWDQPIG